MVVVLGYVWLFATPGTVVGQTPPSVEFSGREYWSELPFPTPRDLPDPGTEFTSLASPALAGRFFTTMPPGKPTIFISLHSQHSEKDHSGRHPSTKQTDEGSRKLLWGTACTLGLTDGKGRDPRASLKSRQP